MSKSTPISQLPPQHSPSSMTDILLDDDATVQEVLNQIAQTQNDMPKMMPQQQAPVAQHNQLNSMTPQQQQMLYASNAPTQDFSAPPQMPPYVMYNNHVANTPKNFFDFDLKTVGMIIAITIFVQVFPIEQFVNKYVSIEGLPYSTIIVKAVLAGAVFVLITKYML